MVFSLYKPFSPSFCICVSAVARAAHKYVLRDLNSRMGDVFVWLLCTSPLCNELLWDGYFQSWPKHWIKIVLSVQAMIVYVQPQSQHRVSHLTLVSYRRSKYFIVTSSIIMSHFSSWCRYYIMGTATLNRTFWVRLVCSGRWCSSVEVTEQSRKSRGKKHLHRCQQEIELKEEQKLMWGS